MYILVPTNSTNDEVTITNVYSHCIATTLSHRSSLCTRRASSLRTSRIGIHFIFFVSWSCTIVCQICCILAGCSGCPCGEKCDIISDEYIYPTEKSGSFEGSDMARGRWGKPDALTGLDWLPLPPLSIKSIRLRCCTSKLLERLRETRTAR